MESPFSEVRNCEAVSLCPSADLQSESANLQNERLIDPTARRTVLSRSLIDKIDRFIRRDPAQRGLIGSESEYGPLCPGHLFAAAEHLAEHGEHVGLVTGFYIPGADPPAAETDGPPGAIMLALALAALEIRCTILTDSSCVSAVRVAATAAGCDEAEVVVYPHASPQWLREFYTSGPGSTLTHLVSVERVGPSHHVESLTAQSRDSQPPVEGFLSSVPAENRGRCHNMRGEIIDEQTADMHRLFEELAGYRPQAKTIGIGDGGNEIGMGSIPWEMLVQRLEGQHASRIPCRIATDWNIVAGTSNWGGYALAAAVLLLRDQQHRLADWGRAHQQAVLEHMVEAGPAVDGVTRRCEATVDGLPFETYIQPWDGIRRLLGIDD